MSQWQARAVSYWQSNRIFFSLLPPEERRNRSSRKGGDTEGNAEGDFFSSSPPPFFLFFLPTFFFLFRRRRRLVTSKRALDAASPLPSPIRYIRIRFFETSAFRYTIPSINKRGEEEEGGWGVVHEIKKRRDERTVNVYNVYGRRAGGWDKRCNRPVDNRTRSSSSSSSSLLFLLVFLLPPSIIIKPCRCRAWRLFVGKKGEERRGIDTFRLVSFFRRNYREGVGDGVLDQPVFRLATSSRCATLIIQRCTA